MAGDVILNPELLGVDIATGATGDFVANGSDFGTISGVANVVNAFVRELTTPYGYLARFVEDSGGLKIIDEDYGNPGYQQLSEPMDQEWIDFMVDSIEQVAENHPRIEMNTVDYEILNLAVNHGIKFRLRFRVLGVPKDFNLVLTRSNGTLLAALEA